VREYAAQDGFWYYTRTDSEGGRICMKTVVPEDTSHTLQFSVIRILVSITPGELLEKNVTVNGVLADVYEIKDLSLLLARTLEKVSGKVWIAKDPVYFLKAEAEVEGKFEWENRWYTGGASFTYAVKDFDQVSVVLPPLCAYPPEEMIPVPENAVDVRVAPPRINFISPDTGDAVKAWYLEELAAQGWEAAEDTTSTFGQVVRANITTPQGVTIQVEVKIHSLDKGSSVAIAWMAE
jgi:hypothetical protein